MQMRRHELKTLHYYKEQMKTVAVLQPERTNVKFCSKFGQNQFSVTTTCEVLILIHLLTATGLTPGGSSTVHIYT
jgi:hypothetical protein